MNNTNQEQFTTPILLTGFNRPDTTQKVFNEIRKIKPRQFFFAVDGPRKNKPGEEKLCEQTREIIKQIDWKCEVKTLFQIENLGCGYGMSGAITWFFNHVSEGIILEDDCVPDQSFFYFCQEMLEKYRENKKILMISGDNFQAGHQRGSGSYYFSIYPLLWGWATWRRGWEAYDFNIVPIEKRKADWGYQWVLSMRKNRGLAILPNVNLVSNIGFRPDATHTTMKVDFLILPPNPINFPLVHPKHVIRNMRADFFTHRFHFNLGIRGFIGQEFRYYLLEPFKSFFGKNS